ncbi:hypothetical protein PsorP6_003149 [Peronosclerospora sorghi]|uniref:Uncharacterized protein n=1 Tax=Peronosclerospora sorghi TaxID=230839 RepID=A0ACC0VL06_9STRA|nr:hypothetical protein PsorP6_003149 [Peronosclerospora sorghi]
MRRDHVLQNKHDEIRETAGKHNPWKEKWMVNDVLFFAFSVSFPILIVLVVFNNLPFGIPASGTPFPSILPPLLPLLSPSDESRQTP